MIGQGRSVNEDIVRSHIIELELYYLIPDITCFPKVRVILLPGLELIDKCTNKGCSFTVNHANDRLFKPYAIES